MTGTVQDYEFIDLARTFHEIDQGASDDDETSVGQAWRTSERLRWDDLLKEYRVVVLAEAGAGKTSEIRNVARTLRRTEKQAFFIRLEYVADDFEIGFEVGSIEQFQTWMHSRGEGWLFLDSVDESRLKHPGDFERAIRLLGRRLAEAKDRTHIFITGRTTAWRPKSDLTVCTENLPFAGKTNVASQEEEPDINGSDHNFTTSRPDQNGRKPIFKLVTLDDLRPEQVEIFAKTKQVSNTKHLHDAIERADAWSFTTRPQDLDELITFWKDQGRIGSRFELMRNSIRSRLEERHQGRAETRPLSAEKARYGARLIAAAATLSQEPTIRVPDGAESTKGLSLRDVLPDWDEADLATLLARPIFDEAIYGTVRFHHRSVREYLTAEWFTELLKKETSRRRIEGLFFRKQYGVDVVTPALRPILPWLVIFDERIRGRVLTVAPDVVFEGGDPSQLPLSVRRSVLRDVCQQMAEGYHANSATAYASVQRFANLDLVEDIRELLGAHSEHEHVQSFLLRMIWLGELVPLARHAVRIALSPLAPEYMRIAAFRAVKAVATDDDNVSLRKSFLEEAPTINRGWLAELVVGTKPSVSSLEWLLACLERSEPKKRFSVDRLADAVLEFAKATDLNLLPRLVGGLNDLLNRPPIVERRFCEISQRFSWLLGPAGLAVQRLVDSRHPQALGADALSVLHKMPLSRDYLSDDFDRTSTDFSSRVPDWTDLNRALFWYGVDRSREAFDRTRGERLTEVWQVSMSRAYWRFDPDDFNYVLTQIGKRAESDDKLVALSLAFRIYANNGRPPKWRTALKRTVEESSELAEKLDRYLQPPKDEESQKWKRQEARWKRQSAQREKTREKNRAEWRKQASEHVAQLRDPQLDDPSQITDIQHYLHSQMRKDDSLSGRWTDGNWRALVSEHGEDVAQAFRDGVVAYWRKNSPILISEGAERFKTFFSTIFGLSGLEIEASETPDWPSQLTFREAELACRYAAHELNGFPTWFPSLLAAFPSLVTGFLLKEIEFELDTESIKNESHYILSNVSWSGNYSWPQIGPAILSLLQVREPLNASSLRKLLRIVQGSLVSDSDIQALTEIKVRSGLGPIRTAIWHAVWVGVDPEAAIPALGTYLDGLEDGIAVDSAMTFATSLGNQYDHGIGVRKAFQTPQYLKSLYLLLHRYVRRSEDIDRSDGGVYSPELRDHAQEARNSLFEALNKIPGKEAFLALEEISESHPEEDTRPWMRQLAKKKAEQDADIHHWSPTQVRDFNDKLENTPANHEQLADFAAMRFLDLKDDLENGDSSVAGILRQVSAETDMRKYIGRELREKAFARYTIPQEEEMADAKKPDLRFHGVGFDGPVPVELKLADKWTGPALFERLENQLCGDYLRDNRSSRGLFVLVFRGECKGWMLPGAKTKVNFDDLAPALQAHWEAISRRYPNVEDILVVGIDLTKRHS